MRFIRRANNQNVTIGIILLIALAFFAGPDTLPRVLSRLSPYFEGVPCANLRRANDRANHQSLIGRNAADALELRVRSSAIPTDASGFLTIQITVINDSMGTVAIVYNPDQVIIGDNGSSGLGLIFTPTNSLATTTVRQDSPSFPENNIRVLGPRQRCIHTTEIPAGNVLVDPSLTSGQSQVIAYYRGTSPGAIAQNPAAVATPIYPDQGLWTGLAQSEPVGIPIAAQ